MKPQIHVERPTNISVTLDTGLSFTLYGIRPDSPEGRDLLTRLQAHDELLQKLAEVNQHVDQCVPVTHQSKALKDALADSRELVNSLVEKRYALAMLEETE